MMQEFDAPFWSWYIIVLTVVSLVGVALFLASQRTRRLAPGEKAQEMAHKWDGDLVELLSDATDLGDDAPATLSASGLRRPRRNRHRAVIIGQ